MDEVSKAIGQLQGEMKGVVSSVDKVFEKLDTMHTEQTNQKIDAAKISVKMGIITAVAVLGLAEGIRYYIRTYGGN